MTSQEEEIKEESGQERDSWFILIIGIVVSLIGYIVYDFHINRYITGREVPLSSEYPYQFIGLLLIIIGIVIISIGIAKKIFSRV